MPDKKESKLLRFAYYAIPIVLVAYVLSIGPVEAVFLHLFYVHTQEPGSNVALGSIYVEAGSFYFPLTWAANKNQFINETLKRYINLCHRLIFPDTHNYCSFAGFF